MNGDSSSTTNTKPLPYGDGSNKIFGMENFGNTCYCNSILQCLFYTENFRTQLAQHKITVHDRKLSVTGVKPHGFTTKYEQMVAKRAKEQGKSPQLLAASEATERPKSSRKGSIFGIKFNSNSSNSNNNSKNMNGSNESDINKNSMIVEAKNCETLSTQQRILIKKNIDFQNLPLLITRSSSNPANPANKNSYSQSSSMLLNNDQTNANGNNSTQNGTQKDETSITPQSCVVIVGIPQPESYLSSQIYPINPNPSIDQRKRSALINGPIINLDHSLQLPTQQSDDSALLYSLKDIFECMIENKSQTGVVSPTYFINKLKDKNYLFRQNNMHHDAHEFFNYLINEIIECLDKENGLQNNWCNKLFQGLITNETKCLSCETVTSKEETFLDLSVDVPPGESSYSLTYSLNNFSRLETLTHQNKFYCNTCSSLQEATKTIKLKDLPEILVINFKRFKYDENVDKMVKLFDSISYPSTLRLFNTTTTSKKNEDKSEDDFSLYDLYALVVHIGGGPMHGHYISLCKIKAKLWLLFDDETVELVDDAYVMRFFGNGPGLASAYILFYQKCDTTDDSEDAIDFGFNVNDMYDGGDYSLAQNFRNTSVYDNSSISTTSVRKTSSVSSAKFNNPVVEEADNDNERSSTRSSSETFETKDYIPLGTSSDAGSFSKRQFMNPFKDSTLKESSETRPTGINLPAPNKSLSENEKETPTPKSEKKSWVGGLKRRESKLISTLPGIERKSSSASMKTISSQKGNGNANSNGSGNNDSLENTNTTEKEKKKGFFSFRRNK